MNHVYIFSFLSSKLSKAHELKYLVTIKLLPVICKNGINMNMCIYCIVAESKGNDLQNSQLRGSEESKIECAHRHFKAISENGYIYDVAKDYKSLYDIVTK